MGVRVRRREWIDGEARGRSSHIWFRHSVTQCLKSILFHIYLCWQLTTLFLFNILSTCKYLRTCEFLTHGSKSPGGWNPHRSRYSILNLKYPRVWIRVTRECTRALPYMVPYYLYVIHKKFESYTIFCSRILQMLSLTAICGCLHRSETTRSKHQYGDH
jgi:hypothetical protein